MGLSARVPRGGAALPFAATGRRGRFGNYEHRSPALSSTIGRDGTDRTRNAEQQKMEESSIRQRISKSDLFSGLPAELIDFLAEHAKSHRLAAGDVLFRFGERANRFYLVQSGHVAVEIAAIAGPALELQDLGPGAVLGWSWLIAPHQWSFQARAKTAGEILEFDGDAVLARCEEDTRFGYQLLKRFSALMSERLNSARQRMMETWNPAGFA
jgi:CRP-like cAMP-binding protein